MATWTNVPLRFPEADRLAGLNGILIDLEWTRDVCQRLVATLKRPPHDFILLEAFSSAAVTRYARCFATGIRRTLRANMTDITGHLSTEEVTDHDYFMDVRNKHIAHSVNPYENNCVTTLVPQDIPPDWRIEGIGFHQDRVVSFGASETKRLQNLVQRVSEYVKAQIETERPLVLDRAQGIPVSHLVKLEVVTPPIVSDAHARRVRTGA